MAWGRSSDAPARAAASIATVNIFVSYDCPF
jgi:hypothetical protein